MTIAGIAVAGVDTKHSAAAEYKNNSCVKSINFPFFKQSEKAATAPAALSCDVTSMTSRERG